MSSPPPCGLLALPLEILQAILKMIQDQDIAYVSHHGGLDVGTVGKDWKEIDEMARIRSQEILEEGSKWYGRSLWAWSMTCRRLNELTEAVRFETLTLKLSDSAYYASDIYPRHAHQVTTLVLNEARASSTRYALLSDVKNGVKTLVLWSSSFRHLQNLHFIRDFHLEAFLDLHSTPAVGTAREAPEIKAMRTTLQNLYLRVTEISLEGVHSCYVDTFLDRFLHLTSLKIAIADESEDPNYIEDYASALAKATKLEKLTISTKIMEGRPRPIMSNWASFEWQFAMTLTELDFATWRLEKDDWQFLVHVGTQVKKLTLDLTRIGSDLERLPPPNPSAFPSLVQLSVTGRSSSIQWLWTQLPNSPLQAVSFVIRNGDLEYKKENKKAVVISPFILALRNYEATLRSVRIEPSDIELWDWQLVPLYLFGESLRGVQFVIQNIDVDFWKTWVSNYEENDREREDLRRKYYRQIRRYQVETVLNFIRGRLDQADETGDLAATEEIASLLAPARLRMEVEKY